MHSAEPPDEAFQDIKAERELAELEKKLGLTGNKLPGDLEAPRGFSEGNDDILGEGDTGGVPAPVLPRGPVRPATNAKPFPPRDE